MLFSRTITSAIALIGLIASGCSSLPTSGPYGLSINKKNAKDAAVQYCLVEVNETTPGIVRKYQHRLAGRFTDRRPPTTIRVGVGDVVGVTLFEAAAGGLFFSTAGGNRQGNFLPLPNQTVDERGKIFVPYAGGIRAAGRTVSAIQDSIVKALKDRALEPQAIVTIIEQRDAQVTILGTVSRSARVPVSASGDRMLDAIARAGGISSPGHETWVLLERRRRIAAAPFEALIHEPGNNIFVRPKDTIYVFQEPQTFVVFGATGSQNHIPFGTWRLSLAEALGKAGGLNQNLADPSWVFLYRMEHRAVLDELKPKNCKYDPKARHVPVIFKFNLRDPSGFFLARRMPMWNKDVLYVSNSKSVKVTKFLTYLGEIYGGIQDPINTTISGYALKSAIEGTSSGAAVIVGGGGAP